MEHSKLVSECRVSRARACVRACVTSYIHTAFSLDTCAFKQKLCIVFVRKGYTVFVLVLIILFTDVYFVQQIYAHTAVLPVLALGCVVNSGPSTV